MKFNPLELGVKNQKDLNRALIKYINELEARLTDLERRQEIALEADAFKRS